MKPRTLYALRRDDETKFYKTRAFKFKRERECGRSVNSDCACRIVMVPDAQEIGAACGLKPYIGFELPANRLVKITVSSAKPVRKR
jgi:hypothetical protein